LKHHGLFNLASVGRAGQYSDYQAQLLLISDIVVRQYWGQVDIFRLFSFKSHTALKQMSLRVMALAGEQEEGGG